MNNDNAYFCPLCNNRLTIRYNLNYHRCNNCDVLVRNKDKISDLDKMYSENWETPLANIPSTGGTSVILAKEYIQLLLGTLGEDDFNNQVILDFGAGKGEIIDELIQNHAIIYGFEPYGYSYLQTKGVSVFNDMDTIPDDLLFDGIINIDVIEHVIDPFATLNFMQNHLKPGGWLFTATPNIRSLNALITGSSWRETQNPGHICLFSSKGLKRLMKKSGFVQIKRLKWFIKYSISPERNFANHILTSLKLDGELRFLSIKPKLRNENSK